MIEQAGVPAPLSSIAAVERDTGLSKDTLRVWERRYGFPQPARDHAGDRVYPSEQVERLRVIRRLMDAGHRPGGIVALELGALQTLAAPAEASPTLVRPSPRLPDVAACLALIEGHDVQALRRLLVHTSMRVGLVSFVTQLLAPLTVAVGEAWMAGRFQVFEEHLYTECVTGVLRNAISSLPSGVTAGAPRVVLSSVPDEPHALGLLMVETLLALEGCNCLSLGPQTPIADMAKAAQAHRADIVALSFTPVVGTRSLVSGLQALRQLLPGGVEIWAGGSHPALAQRAWPGVRVIQSLAQVPDEVAAWSARTVRPA